MSNEKKLCRPPQGRKAKRLWWYNSEGGESSLTLGTNEELLYHHQYCGDHEENWILHFRGGQEIARYNVAYISTIEWDLEGGER